MTGESTELSNASEAPTRFQRFFNGLKQSPARIRDYFIKHPKFRRGLIFGFGIVGGASLLLGVALFISAIAAISVAPFILPSTAPLLVFISAFGASSAIAGFFYGPNAIRPRAVTEPTNYFKNEA